MTQIKTNSPADGLKTSSDESITIPKPKSSDITRDCDVLRTLRSCQLLHNFTSNCI